MEPINRIDDHGDTYSVPYVPEDRKRHRWEDLFRDIPMTMSKGPDGLWMPSGGAMFLPHTAARLAEHVELCGYGDPDPGLAQVRRIALPRGAYRWQDVRSEMPNIDPVDSVHTVASAALTSGEKQALIERLQNDIQDS